MIITKNIRMAAIQASIVASFFAAELRAEVAWTTGSCAPDNWIALSNNLLGGQTGTISGLILTNYSTNDPDLLTNGEVPGRTTNADDVKVCIVGFQNNASIKWTFEAPKTLELVRISCGYPVMYQNYSGARVAAVEVQTFGSSVWIPLNTTTGDYADNGQNEIQSLTLADGSGAPLAEAVVALRVTFGSPYGLAGYCCEIEAVGSAGAAGPIIGAFDIAPAKTKAKVSGLIADAGSDATECDIYLSLNGGAATKIAEGASGSFEYQIQGLTAGTTYDYALSVSNNATTAKGTVRSGTFTTLAADAQTKLWTTGEGVPGDFSPLANNLLAGMIGTASSSPSSYGGSVDLLTNGEVSDVTKQTVGFGENVTVAWSFNGPKTVEKIRFTTCYTAGHGMYDDIKVAKIEVKTSSLDEWADIGADAVNFAGSGSSGTALFATLSDIETGFLGQSVTAIRITFGKPNNVAQYYAEIEAVGFAEATGPVISSFDIAPAKTKAALSGSIADPGTDATECDVYLSINGGAAKKVASGVTDTFDYQIKTLTAGTTYAYTLSISNNAPTAKGTVRSGTFTTLAADAQTASWTQGEYATADWTPLAGNILEGLSATETSGVSTYASQDMTKLTNGSVPNPAAGAETVGFGNGGTIAWAFEKPMTIETLRLSSLWETTYFNGISVNAIHVMFKGSAEWTALDVPTVEWASGTQLGQTETLVDAENGFLAQRVVGLKITFGPIKGGVANYYAEIEAVGHSSSEDLHPTVISLH